MALPAADGALRRADELVLPGAPLLDVLAADAVGHDAPLAVLQADLADEWPADVLRAVGVLESFSLVVDESPIGPEHALADEAEWWTWAGEDVPVVLGIRDLDLVDPAHWPEALRLLADEPRTRRAMAQPHGYVAWWLARFAVLDGVPLREWRLADADDLAGLYDPVPDLGLSDDLLVAIGVRDALTVADADQAADLLRRLGDPTRTVTPGLAFAAHDVLADAALTEIFDPAEIDPPDRVRALSGDAVPAEDAAVVDRPWLAAVLDPARVVASRGLGSQLDGALADLLSVPLASETVVDEPESAGEAVAWADLGAVVLACDLVGAPVPDGVVRVHDGLTVAGRRVAWWVSAGEVHIEDSPEGMGRALAWTMERWQDRWQLVALLADPTPEAALW